MNAYRAPAPDARMMPASPQVLARLRSVPTRAMPAIVLFGGMLGAPMLLGVLAGVAGSLGVDALAAIFGLLAFGCFLGFVIFGWVSIFTASSRITRAEQAVQMGDYESATRDAMRVIKTVFRSDYQMGALFVLALTAERLGAFAEAGVLFARALDMIPAMAATRPGSRARALLGAHAAIDFAAAGDRARAQQMLARCNMAIGAVYMPSSGLGSLFDDSGMGALGINSMLNKIEGARDPRPLAVLASMVVAYKDGQLGQAAQLFAVEQASIGWGLAPHERALAERIHADAMRLTAGAGPHRAAGDLAAPQNDWAALVLR